MTKRPGLSLYNPQQSRLSDKDFVEGFVARKGDLGVLVDELRANASGGHARHLLLVGARGMGKSSMLRRIAIAVREEDGLASALMALSFREEQYNVISLDAFWRNCGEALAEWCEKNGKVEIAPALDKAVGSPEWRSSEAAEEAFLSTCKQIGRRPVLLLDNLDILLESLKEKDSWLLRRALQEEGGPIVIGGATQLLTQAGDRDAPFYEFFYPHFLEPLTEAEVMACLVALADRNAEEGARVRDVLTRYPERVRAIFALSGGNPRILTLLYLVLQRAETDDIFTDLEALLDQVTPYYKHRIEEFQSPQQRAVIDAIALHWDPITSRAISVATGIEITTISSHLNRLKKTGFIDEVESSGARSSYQLSERFMNIWYLMRHGTRRTRQRLRWLTLFLVRLFSPEELRSMAAEIRSGGPVNNWHPSYRDAVVAAEELATGATKERERITDRKLGPGTKPGWDRMPTVQIWDEAWGMASQAFRDGNYPEVLRQLDLAIGGVEEAADLECQALIARALLDKGFTLGHLARTEEEIAVYEDVAARFSTSDVPGVQEQVACALNNKGVTLSDLGRREEAISVYDDVASRFSTSDVPGVQEQVACALNNKGVTLSDLGRSEEAIAVYDDVASRFSTSDAPGVQEEVARALKSKAARLGHLGRTEEEIAVYEDVAARFSTSDVPGVQEQVARALNSKGFTFGQMGRTEEAISVYEDVVARFSASDAPGVQEQVARALNSKGFTFGQMGRREEAISVYEDVAARFSTSDVPGVQEQVARALFNKGFTFGQMGRTEEAISVYEDVAARFSTSDAPGVQEQVARALNNNGITFGQMGRMEEATSVYEDVAARFSTSDAPGVQEQVARALFNKGFTFGQMGRTEEEIAVYEDAAARFSTSDVPGVQEQVARALFNKGFTFGQMGRTEDEVAVYENVAARFSASDVPGVQEQVARALNNKGITFSQMDRTEEAISVYEDVAARFSTSDAPGVQEQVARALFNKGFTFGQMGSTEEAISVYKDVAARFSTSDAPGVQEQVARALLNKGFTFGQMGRTEEAISVYEDVAARFSTSDVPGVQEQVARALTNKGRLGLNLLADAQLAEAALRDALTIIPTNLRIKANLSWALIFHSKLEEVTQLRDELAELDAEGLALLDAGIELVRENFGLAAAHLGDALDHGVEHDSSDFFEDLLWVIRLAVKHEFGERLIEWFEETGNHDKYAPVFAALVAYVRGERFLNDVNPETRASAKTFFDQLTAPDRAKGKKEEKPKRGRKRRK